MSEQDIYAKTADMKMLPPCLYVDGSEVVTVLQGEFKKRIQFQTLFDWYNGSNEEPGPVGDINWGDIDGALSAQTDLQAALDAKAASAHNHDGSYSPVGHDHDADYSDIAHNHDLDYATIAHNHDAEYAALGHNHDASYAAIGHNHDGNYSLLSHDHDASYSALGHVHAYDDLTDKPTLGTAAVKNVGTGADDVAAGNHTHPGGSEAFPIGSVFIAVVNTDPATLLGYGTWASFAAGKMLVGLDSGDTDFDAAEETGGEKTHTLLTSEMPSHTHIQDAHNHTQDSHNHTQDAHNHTQDAHSHVQNLPTNQTGGQASGTRDTSTNGSTPDALSTATAVATNQAATATNQAATATNQAATATNQNAGGDGAHNNMPPYIVVYMWKRTA